MVPTLFSARAPGSLMFLGEHAVLHGKRAIVVAVNQYVTVTLSVRSDQRVIIRSSLGEYDQTLENIQIENPFQFVLAALLYFRDQLKKIKTGLELNIESDFSHTLGLGSSAAVTVATVAVLLGPHPPLQGTLSRETGEGKFESVFLSSPLPNKRPAYHYPLPFHGRGWCEAPGEGGQGEGIYNIAKKIIQSVQGVGSGADVAASVYGGVIVYQGQAPYIIKQLPFTIPLRVIYSGSKTPTPIAIKRVEAARQKNPAIFEALFEGIDSVVHAAIPLIEKEAWPELGELLNIQQGLMNAMGVGTPLLNQLVDMLNSDPSVYGSKISGSGLGDCIIGLGTKTKDFISETPDVKELKVLVSSLGVTCEGVAGE